MSRFAQFFGPPILLTVALPLGALAFVTTTVAFTVLFLRASVVYLELGLALVQNAILPHQASIKRKADKITQESNHKRRRSSAASFQPSMLGAHGDSPLARASSAVSLFGYASTSRDFEGMGGWRLAADEKEDQTWTSFNTRLELPAVSTGDRQRRHRRSLSSQSQKIGRNPESFRMSPVQSRQRTPQSSSVYLAGQSVEYFSFRPGGQASMSPEESAARHRMEERRLSIGASSVSSTTSLKTVGTAT